jgi:hypothetical protein
VDRNKSCFDISLCLLRDAEAFASVVICNYSTLWPFLTRVIWLLWPMCLPVWLIISFRLQHGNFAVA